MLDHALNLWERGFRVFPLGTANERPPKYLVDRFIRNEPGRVVTPEQALEIATAAWPKTPRFSWKALQDRDVERDEVESWWERFPNANIGIVTGPIIVVDADAKDTVDWVVNNTELTFTPLRVNTSQGAHFYYRAPAGSNIRNSVDVKAKLDIRGVGGYVVGAGSVHSSGTTYDQVITQGYEIDSLNDLPIINQNDLNLIARFNGYEVEEMPADGLIDMRGVSVPADNRPAKPGERNNHATSLAGQYIKAGASLETTIKHLRNWNDNNPVPLDDAEVAQVVASVGHTHARNTGQPVPVSDPAPRETDHNSGRPAREPDHKKSPEHEPSHTNLTAESETPHTLASSTEPVHNPAPETRDPDHVSPPVPPPSIDPDAPLPPPSSGITHNLQTIYDNFHAKFFTLGELYKKPIVPLDNFWQKSLIFRRSRILIAGEPKIGKSRFTLHMAVQAACGGGWLGSRFERPIKVIWIQAEIREWHLRERTAIATKSLSQEEKALVERNLMVSDRFDCDLLDETEFGLIDSVFDRHKPDLVIFDPLINFISANENDAQEMGRALRQLNRLEAKHDCAIGLIHHTRKLESSGFGGKKKTKSAATFDDVRGSSAITGWPDMGIVLSGTPEVTQASWMARACKPPPTGNIGWNEQLGAYEIEMGDVAPLNTEYADYQHVTTSMAINAMVGILAENVGQPVRQGVLLVQANKMLGTQTEGMVLGKAIQVVKKRPDVVVRTNGPETLLIMVPSTTDP